MKQFANWNGEMQAHEHFKHIEQKYKKEELDKEFTRGDYKTIKQHSREHYTKLMQSKQFVIPDMYKTYEKNLQMQTFGRTRNEFITKRMKELEADARVIKNADGKFENAYDKPGDKFIPRRLSELSDVFPSREPDRNAHNTKKHQRYEKERRREKRRKNIERKRQLLDTDKHSEPPLSRRLQLSKEINSVVVQREADAIMSTFFKLHAEHRKNRK